MIFNNFPNGRQFIHNNYLISIARLGHIMDKKIIVIIGMYWCRII